jgi:bis(5'-nucleosyl)-tetraphosphatase (symmetrical)
MSTYVIGDIHGCFTQFNELRKRIEHDDSDANFILVGDLTHRGHEEEAMLEWAFNNITSNGKYRMVLGNHDDAFIELCGRGEFQTFYSLAENVGLSYTPTDSLKRFKASPDRMYEYACFLAAQPLFINVEKSDRKYIIVHAWHPDSTRDELVSIFHQHITKKDVRKNKSDAVKNAGACESGDVKSAGACESGVLNNAGACESDDVKNAGACESGDLNNNGNLNNSNDSNNGNTSSTEASSAMSAQDAYQRRHRLLWERDINEFGIWKRRYVPKDGEILIHGHTPTLIVRDETHRDFPPGKVWDLGTSVNIDCGLVFSVNKRSDFAKKYGNLAAYNLDTGKAVYLYDIPHP